MIQKTINCFFAWLQQIASPNGISYDEYELPFDRSQAHASGPRSLFTIVQECDWEVQNCTDTRSTYGGFEGLVASSPDPPETETAYQYDAIGRLLWDKRAGNHGAWTQYASTRATSALPHRRITMLLLGLCLVIAGGLPGMAGAYEVRARIATPQPVGDPIPATLLIESQAPGGNSEGSEARRVALGVPGAVQVDLPGRPPWRLRLTSEGFWSPPREIEAAKPAEIELLLFPTGEVHGELAPTAGPPPDSIVARFLPAPTASDPAKLMGPEGNLPCDLGKGVVRCSLPAGLLDLHLSADGFAPLYFWALEVRAGTDRGLGRLGFVPGGSLLGRVVDDRGEPVSGVEVSLAPYVPSNRSDPLFLMRFRQRVFTGQSNARGIFQLTGLPLGAYRVKANKEGYSPARFDQRIVFHDEVEQVLPKPLTLLRPVELVLGEPPTGSFWSPLAG